MKWLTNLAKLQENNVNTNTNLFDEMRKEMKETFGE